MPTGSSVGSLYPVIAAQAVKGEFPLSFLQPKYHDLEAWKRLGRKRVFDLMSYAPPKCPPNAECVERLDRGDHWREKVYFNTTPDIRLCAYVLIPKHAKLPAPGIVALHDHGAFFLWGKEKLVSVDGEHPSLTEFKRTGYGGHSIADELVRQGYVVIVIDMFYWGDRRMILDDDPADWVERPLTMPDSHVVEFNRRSSENIPLVSRTVHSTGITWYGLMVWDDIRTLDYLASRPEVDPKRLGCIGLSVGSYRTGQLAALDERIKAAVAVCWMTSFRTQLKDRIRNTIGDPMLLFGAYRDMDYPDVVSMACPRALLTISGKQDGLFTHEGIQASYDKLTAVYKKAGVPEKVRCSWYDSPHEFNLVMQDEAWAWFREWL